MTIGAQDLELIKKEVAGIRDFYQSRMDSELPPLKAEVDRIATKLAQIQEMWRDGEKRAILAKYSGGDRTRVTYGKYMGRDPWTWHACAASSPPSCGTLQGLIPACWRSGSRT